MKNHPGLADLLTEKDELALKNLVDVRVKQIANNPVRLAVLLFHFILIFFPPFVFPLIAFRLVLP